MLRKCGCCLLALLIACVCIGCRTVETVYSVEEEQVSDTTDGTTVQTTATSVTTRGSARTTKPYTRTVTTTSRTRRTRAEQTVESVDVKLMTFNVRYTNDPNGHSIAERAPRVAATVSAHDPDIVGMQEVVPAWNDQLQARLSAEYDILTHYRSTKNPEGLSILYKKDLFELVEEDFFWLSETPDTESKGWGASLPRIASWALLRHRETGREILFICYHGEWNDEFTINSCRMITALTERYPQAAHFLVGDFNRAYTTVGYEAFARQFDDARFGAGATGYHDDEGSSPQGYPDPTADTADKANIIDYIFYKKAQSVSISFTFDRTRYDGYFASDHYAGVAVLRIK